MNREDLIAKRARAYAYAELAKIGSNQTIWFTAPLFDSEDLQTAYLQGVKDAEDNPTWRICEDELPEPDTQCWCATSDGKEIIARFNGKFWSYSGTRKKDIVAWLPLPKFKV